MRKALLALPIAAAAFGLGTLTQPAETQTATLQRLVDEAELARIPTEVEIAVDRKEWARARSFFADQVAVDFTSLAGGTPATIPADALIAAWSANLKGNKESLHIRGGALVTIEGDRATVRSNGYAWNRRPGGPDGDLWEVWGEYTHGFTRTASGWRVTAFTFRATHQRGSSFVRNTPGE